jgi:hypothetical protein
MDAFPLVIGEPARRTLSADYQSAFADAYEVVRSSKNREEALSILTSLDIVEQERSDPSLTMDDGTSDLYD